MPGARTPDGLPSEALNVEWAAARHGAEPALIDDVSGATFSYARIAELTARTGCPAETERFTPFVADGSVHTVLRLLAGLRAGVPLLPLHARFTAEERAATLARYGAELGQIWCDEHHPVPKSSPVDDSSPAFALLTSGSTGQPRAVELSRGALLAAAAASATNLPLAPGSRWLLALPPAHVGGVSVLIRCLLAGAAVVLADPESLREPGACAALLQRHRITHLSLVPTQLHRLLESDTFRGTPTLTAILLGGAAATPTLLARARALDLPVLPTYGLTEACAQVATRPLGAALTEEPDAAIGPLLPSLKVDLDPRGAIRILGPTLLTRYLGEPRGTRATVFQTADAGAFDERGWLRVLGRLDDVLISGGENVHPLEVESVFAAEPAVLGSCLIGVPDARWGQRLELLVAVAPGTEEAALRRRLAALAEALAPFKRPKAVHFTAQLPLTPTGKLDRRAAASWLAAART